MKEEFFTISGGGLTAVVSTKGAELQSLKDTDGREYNWQGAPPYWEGRGPVLFPATGAPWNETYFIGETAYRMPKHGFVRKELFAVADHTDDCLVLLFSPTDGTRALYPFDYALRVRFQVAAGRLDVAFEVENKGSAPLCFQLGGHPALAVPGFDGNRAVNGYVRLHWKDPGENHYLIRAREQGCIQEGRFPVPVADNGLVPLCVNTFANEALIFEAHQVGAIELVDLDLRHVATVESDAPCWLVWQMQGVNCPFVCFEPWYGLPDNEGESRNLHERPYTQVAPPKGIWKGGFSISV